jgi:ABC-type molybdate transport system permease subunit
MLFWRSRRGATPQGLSKWLAAFAGLAFLGSAVGVVYQMLKALSTTGTTTEAFITLVLVILPIVLGVVTLLYAVRVKPTLTLWSRVVLIATGIIALFAWAGLYLGPAIVIAAAIVPPYLT